MLLSLLLLIGQALAAGEKPLTHAMSRYVDLLVEPREGAARVKKVYQQEVVAVLQARPSGCRVEPEPRSCWREFEVDGKRGFVPVDMMINDHDDIEYRRYTVAEKTFLYPERTLSATPLRELAEGLELLAVDKKPTCIEPPPSTCWFRVEHNKITGWAPAAGLDFAPREAPWLYTRFPGIGFDHHVLPVETLTPQEYEGLIAAAGHHYRISELLQRTIYPHLKAKPDDPRYAKLKPLLYARKLVRAQAGGGWTVGQEHLAIGRLIPDSMWMDPYLFYLLLRSTPSWWEAAPKAAVVAHAKLALVGWLDEVPRDYLHSLQVGRPDLSRFLLENRKPGDLTLELVPPAARDDRNLVLLALEKTPQAFRLASARLRSDAEILRKAVAGDPWLLRELPRAQRADRTLQDAARTGPLPETAKLALEPLEPDAVGKRFRDRKIALGSRGGHHADEIAWNDGDAVFVLELKNARWGLEARRVVIKRDHDAIADAEGTATGKTVSLVGDPPNPPNEDAKNRTAAMMSGPFTAGPVHAAAYDFKECLPQQKGARTCSFTLGDVEYRVTASYTQDIQLEGGGTTPGYDLTITDGRTQEELKQVPKLDFVGDLDRDGRLDLITVPVIHYNVMGSQELYLSSPAEKGRLFKKVAEYSSVGC